MDFKVSFVTPQQQQEVWRAQLEQAYALAPLDGLKLCDKILTESPAHSPALMCAASLAQTLGLFDLTHMYLTRATEHYPHRVSLFVNLAAFYQLRNNAPLETSTLLKVIELDATHQPSWKRLGQLYYSSNQKKLAYGAYRQAVELGDMSCLSICFMLCGDLLLWDERDFLWSTFKNQTLENFCPFDLLTYPASRATYLATAQQWASQRYTFGTPATSTPHTDTLTVAYLTNDMGEHATLYLFEDVLKHHNHARIKVLCFSYRPQVAPELIERIRNTGSEFHDISALTDAQAARLISEHRVDILVDMKGYTHGERLNITAQRPAPIIVSWLGYPSTLGAPLLADYIIGDPVVTPIEHAAGYSERIAQMPVSYQPNSQRQTSNRVFSRAECGLPEDKLVLCSFNNINKMTPEVMDVWCRILAQHPNTVLWLFCTDNHLQQRIQQEGAARHIHPERWVFANALPQAEHLKRIQLADLALDPFPCNSHTTGSDVLWAGVPMVTLLGETFAARVGASLLNAVGLTQLIAHDVSEYEALAHRCITDNAWRNAFRHTLTTQRKQLPLFDIARYTDDLEHLYFKMWQQHQTNIHEHIIAP